MQINYCDLCNLPLKNNDYYHFYITESQKEKSSYNNLEDYYSYLNMVKQEIKDICPKCKEVIDRIFELRMENLSRLSEELLGIYKLQLKPNPKEGKNGKEK
jgi:hypothetical protein